MPSKNVFLFFSHLVTADFIPNSKRLFKIPISDEIFSDGINYADKFEIDSVGSHHDAFYLSFSFKYDHFVLEIFKKQFWDAKEIFEN